jgi:hypothetical protein
MSSINNKDGPSIQRRAEQIGFVIATEFEGVIYTWQRLLAFSLPSVSVLGVQKKKGS